MSIRAIDRYAYAHDASHYLLVPEEVIKATDTDQLVAEIKKSIESGTPITFRSGGTSLSGQAVTDAKLIDTRVHFKKIEVLDNGARVRVQPGATVREVNARLARFGFKLGPDPASEAACTIGGVIANNSSGMLCGTEFNTYKTLESLVVIFANGVRIDTSQEQAKEQLRIAMPELYEGLLRLREKIISNSTMRDSIEKQFKIKNTMGYGVNSFIDYSTPIDILTHLLIGSEGTLAFIAEATFKTVPLKPFVATSLLLFESLGQATQALPELVSSGLAAIELLDATSLRVAQNDRKATSELKAISIDQHAGLLVEYQELSRAALDKQLKEFHELVRKVSITNHAELTEQASTRGDLWHIRKGLYATVAGGRPSGTTALLEDVAVPLHELAPTCESLMKMFSKHGYEESVIFGHAKDGNIHFLLNERFDDKNAMARYSRFTDEMVDLILSKNGTLKAEHGTGRIMAPFVKRQYGAEIYDVMCEIKKLFDPQGILNPGIIISKDDSIHLKNLKIVPTIDKEVDRCVECGYCEPACPSKNLTLTPRQRIVLRREIAIAEQQGNRALVRAINRDYTYEAVDTCAVDGMCQVACPVLINTGDLVRKIRAEQSSSINRSLWTSLGKRWGLATHALSLLISTAHAIPRLSSAILGAVRRIDKRIPKLNSRLINGGSIRKSLIDAHAEVIYFPSCTSTLFGGTVNQAFLSVCAKAGISVTVPRDIANACCGTPWKSKGMPEGYRLMRASTGELLNTFSKDGQLPIVSDSSSCSNGISDINSEFTVIDSVTFTLNHILPKLKLRKIESLALHPTCSSTLIGNNEDLVNLGKSIANEVYVPDAWSCCGYAGDRGILVPQLTDSATAAEAAEINSRVFDRYVSSNRTCEIGMTQSTGKNYQHIIELIDELTNSL